MRSLGYNIREEKYVDAVPSSEAVKDIATKETAERRATYPSSTVAAVTSSKYLPNEFSYLRHRAFGKNVDGTCSAVATAISIRYLDLAVRDCVPGSLSSEVIDYGKYEWKFDPEGYAKAEGSY